MAKPSSPRPRRAAPPPAAPSAGSAEHYQRFLPAAQALPPAEVRPLRLDFALALANAQRGVAAVLAHRDRLRAELPKLSLAAIDGLGGLGLAVTYAAGQVQRYAPAATGTRALLAQAQELRALLLASAEALARSGGLAPATVAKIREGRGPIDAAGDCVALAALFRRHSAAVRNKTPVTAAQLEQAAAVGSRLLAVLSPKGARRGPVAEVAAATLIRDRLWTLFDQTWEREVWRAGAWLFGREVENRVPLLASRVVAKRPAKVKPPG